ncbi:unnamed protein product [Phytomonas sp. EM1]|nr:unnamed protein product [Phytomonas sp. EM1]|eukprot:CCW61930.1 unnamed protein product [Phytomonas sp. isolate EM1]
MSLPSRYLALLALLSLLSFFNIGACAADVSSPINHGSENGARGNHFEHASMKDDAHNAHTHQQMGTDGDHSYTCQAIFPSSSSPTFPTLNAGAKTQALIAFHNYDPSNTVHILLASGNLIFRNQDRVLQNFSVVRNARVVRPGETVTVDYRFTPSPGLDPGMYSVFLGLHCMDTTTNRTFLATAFRGEVLIGDTLNSDARTILTYFTLIAIILVMVYGICARLGLIRKIVALWRSRKQHAQPRVHTETGTVDNNYDPEYISAEHLRYRDAMLKRHNSPASARKKN